MRTYLYFVTLFLFWSVFTVQAQNYSPIISGDAIFSDDNNLLHVLHVDSIKADIKGSAHYLLKTVDINSQNSCLPYIGAWSGSKIVVASADTYYLFNADEDTIKLQPTKGINNPWILFKYSNGDYIEAQVTLKEQLLFFGLSDSVKTISLQLKNSIGNNITSTVNGLTFKLSKNHGFVSILHISEFPHQLDVFSFKGLSSPNTGAQTLTATDINNFNIGDEFHYDEAESNPPSGTGVFTKRIQVVLSIRISDNTDTVIYKMQNKIKRQTIDWPTNTETIFSKTDTIEKRYLLNQPVYYPEQAISNNFYLGEKKLYPNGEKLVNHYTMSANTNYNDRFILEADNQGPLYNDNCWSNISYNPVEVYTYAYGIGLTKREALYTGVAQSYEKLVYFKKGSETWGVPLVLFTPFAPVGSTWHYTNIESFFYSDKGYVKIESIKDTLIQTKNCKKLITALHRSDGSIVYGDIAFVYTDGDIVYKLADNDLFYVLYNFGAEVGDKWTTRASNHFTGEEVEAEMEVTAVSMVTINEKSLRKLTLNSNNTYASYYQIIETLGGTRYMFPQDYALSDMDIIIPLRCYQDTDFGQYEVEAGTNCTLITATEQATGELGIQVFPNPTEENISIQLPAEYSKIEINLYTVQGALVKSEKLTNTSSASIALPQKGIYFIHLKIDGKDPIIKKVVKL